MKTVSAARSAAVLFGALVAGAMMPAVANAAARTGDVTVASNAAALSASASAAPNQKYCVVQAKMTGTMLDRKVCRTRADWMARGFDPLTPAK